MEIQDISLVQDHPDTILDHPDTILDHPATILDHPATILDHPVLPILIIIPDPTITLAHLVTQDQSG